MVIITNYVSILITFILIYLVSLRGKNTEDKIDGRVVLKFSNLQPIVFSIMSALWLVIGIIAFITFLDERDIAMFVLALVSFVLVFILIVFIFYFLNKVIVFEDDTFYCDSFLHKTREFKYSDIKRIKYNKKEGIKVYMKNKKKFFINEQMSNFSLIFDKLKEDFWV